ncbi:hypothetical protein F2Q70_00029122 [Brassica cretica]|uniref:30S ribosomal protein S8, chloroplastic n=1 Tax=Brassica cretica TaxID=69181 RepID=A0A3N6QBR2_BRACR|nr:hypothetical protein F2Q70_00029122 [Brassica cretica]KAF3591530.1 hypothetical protein DY000_02020295 [Brassica cretica]
MGRRILNDALRTIVNAEKRGKASVELKPVSTVMSSFLRIMKEKDSIRHQTLTSLGCCGDVILLLYDYFAHLTYESAPLCYIKNYQVHDPHRVGRITVDLQGRVNDCKALTYRQDLKAKEIDQYTERTLPTRQWGYVVVTTPDGILDHEEAIKRNVGGQVLGFFY